MSPGARNGLLCRENVDVRHLKQCLSGSVDLCDVVLVADHKRFPVHSQYLASHSQFIKQLVLETGPFTWKEPLVIEQVLHNHTSTCVHAMLLGVYNLGDLLITSPELAWQLYQLTDQLDCPEMLQSCRHYLNRNTAMTKTAGDALHWLTVTAHEAHMDELHTHCANKIATEFLVVSEDPLLQPLPKKHLMLIMTAMSQRMSQQMMPQMCQQCWLSEQRAFKVGRKRKLQEDADQQLQANIGHQQQPGQVESDSSEELSSEESSEDEAVQAVAEESSSEEEESSSSDE